MVDSGIYVGKLRHRRLQGKRHEFTYPIFLALLDVDRLPELMGISPVAAYNRPSLVSYQERDHFGDPARPLRERLAVDAERHQTNLPEGRVMVLTHLRLFGYAFNPVSFYYCHDRSQRLISVLAEVNNTFGETHNYWLDQRVQVPTGESMRYQFGKNFHVSPFFPLEQRYDWTFTQPSETLVVQSMSFEDNQLVFDSTLKLERQEWNARNLHRVLLRYPLMTARVIAGIHWQAIRLLLKGVPVVAHPGKGRYEVRNSQDLGASWKTH